MQTVKNSIVIVGAGIAGVSCAYFLAKQGFEVTLLDQETVGGATSHGNCSLISPSHVLPVNRPGILKRCHLHNVGTWSTLTA